MSWTTNHGLTVPELGAMSARATDGDGVRPAASMGFPLRANEPSRRSKRWLAPKAKERRLPPVAAGPAVETPPAPPVKRRPRILFLNRSYWPEIEATGQLLTELLEDLARQFR